MLGAEKTAWLAGFLVVMVRLFLIYSAFLACFIDGLDKKAADSLSKNERRGTLFLNHRYAVPGAPKRLTLLSFDDVKEDASSEELPDNFEKAIHRARRSINPDRTPEVIEVRELYYMRNLYAVA